MISRSFTFCLLLLAIKRNRCERCNISSTVDVFCKDVYITTEECMGLTSFSNYTVMDPDVPRRLEKTNILTSNGTQQGTLVKWEFKVSRDVLWVRGFIVELFYDPTAARSECRAITFSGRQLKDQEIIFATYFNFSTSSSMSTLNYLVDARVNDWASDILETYNASSALLKVNFDTIFSTRQLEYTVELYYTEEERLVDTLHTRLSSVVFHNVQPGSYFVQISIKNQPLDDVRSCPCFVRFGETGESRSCLFCTERKKTFKLSVDDIVKKDDNDNKGNGARTVTIIIISCVGTFLFVLGLSVVMVTTRRRQCIGLSGVTTSYKSSTNVSQKHVHSEHNVKQKPEYDTTVNGIKNEFQCDVISCGDLNRFKGRPSCHKAYDIFSDSYSDCVCGHVCGHVPVCSTLSDCMVQINDNYDKLNKETSASDEKLDGEAVSIGSNISV